MMQKQGRITVSLVSHGQRDMVALVLARLAELGNPDIMKVVVVHNLPDVDFPKPSGASFDLVQIHNPKPIGFAANHNHAFKQCQTPWFAVLNPDLEFLFGDPFPALLAAGEVDAKLGILAPLLIEPATMQPEPPRGAVTPYEIIRRRLPGWKPPVKPTWLVGAFLFIRHEAFESVQGFDERYRLYCEDVDLSLRIQQVGWKIVQSANAQVLHQKQGASHRNIKYTLWHVESLVKLWIRNFSTQILRHDRNTFK
ncbi:MAG: glycosyltransferase family protein [Acidobacteriaceae bacterium]